MNEMHMRLAALLRCALETKITGEIPSQLKDAMEALSEEERRAVIDMVAGIGQAEAPPQDPPVAA